MDVVVVYRVILAEEHGRSTRTRSYLHHGRRGARFEGLLVMRQAAVRMIQVSIHCVNRDPTPQDLCDDDDGISELVHIGKACVAQVKQSLKANLDPCLLASPLVGCGEI